jgi:hypothetical protein
MRPGIEVLSPSTTGSLWATLEKREVLRKKPTCSVVNEDAVIL